MRFDNLRSGSGAPAQAASRWVWGVADAAGRGPGLGEGRPGALSHGHTYLRSSGGTAWASRMLLLAVEASWEPAVNPAPSCAQGLLHVPCFCLSSWLGCCTQSPCKGRQSHAKGHVQDPSPHQGLFPQSHLRVGKALEKGGEWGGRQGWVGILPGESATRAGGDSYGVNANGLT